MKWAPQRRVGGAVKHCSGHKAKRRPWPFLKINIMRAAHSFSDPPPARDRIVVEVDILKYKVSPPPPPFLPLPTTRKFTQPPSSAWLSHRHRRIQSQGHSCRVQQRCPDQCTRSPKVRPPRVLRNSNADANWQDARCDSATEQVRDCYDNGDGNRYSLWFSSTRCVVTCCAGVFQAIREVQTYASPRISRHSPAAHALKSR